MRSHKTLQLNSPPSPNVVKLTLLLGDKCAQIIQYPTKTNLSVEKELQASQARRAAEDHWQPFKSREKGS